MTRYGKTMMEALAEVQYNSSKLQEATIDMLDHDMTDPDFQKLIKKFRLKAKDLKGDDGTTVTGSVKDIEKMLNTMYGNDWKDMYQQKGQKFVELEQVERESVQEGYSPKQIKMAIGIASDKRYAGGNMSGAVAAIEKIKKGLSDHKQVAAVLKRQNEELEEGKSSTGYELYHKDFSSAMQHAYAFAKKKFGITIDPKEIDDKVASGPKKPSNGKTNSYRLKGNKGNIQVQVANLDNKRYELNMYKEDVQIDEMTAAEKKLIDLMYDKKGNLTPLGKKVMDHGKGKKEGVEPVQWPSQPLPEEMDPTDHVKKKDDKFCVYNADGSVAKEFDNKEDADKYAIDNHDKLMATKKEEVELDEGIEKSYVRMMQIKLREVQKAINPTSAIIKKVVAASGKGKEFKQITKSLTDIYDTLTDIDMNIKEEVELDEASARADAMRAMRKGKTVDPADVDTDASDDDVKSASKNIMMQLRKSVSLRGQHPVEFMDKKKVKIPQKIAQAVLNKHNSFRKPMDKEKFQAKVSKSHKDLLSALKEELKKKEETILDRINSKLKERKNG